MALELLSSESKNDTINNTKREENQKWILISTLKVSWIINSNTAFSFIHVLLILRLCGQPKVGGGLKELNI